MYPLLVNPRGYRRAYPPGTRPTRLARADVARLQALGSFLEAESREVSLFPGKIRIRNSHSFAVGSLHRITSPGKLVSQSVQLPGYGLQIPKVGAFRRYRRQGPDSQFSNRGILRH